MSFVRHFWHAFLDLAEVVASLEGNDTDEFMSTDPTPTQPTSSFPPQPISEQRRTTDSELSGPAPPIEPQRSETLQHSHGKENTVEGINASAELVNTHRIRQDLSDRNQELQQDNVRHLRWQDEASMTIKDLSEEAQVQKFKTRAANQSAVRSEAAMQQQIGKLERQVRNLELEKVWMSNNNAQAIAELETLHRRNKNEVKAQKEAAERAKAAAVSRLTEARIKHKGEMSTARSKIETLQTSTDNRMSEVIRLSDELKDARRAKRRAVEGKSDLCRAKLKANHKVRRLKAKNQASDSKRREAESKVSGAEGCAKGLQDQLRVSNKRVERLETVCKQAEEDAIDKVLSAYTVATPQAPERPQQVTTAASEDLEQSQLIELRKERDELREENRRLTDELKNWSKSWDAAVQNQETWEEEIRRQCDEEKREALGKARGNDGASSKPATMEQEVRRQCQMEKEQALNSLRGQFALKIKSRTKQELQKSRHRTDTERQMRSKVKKRQVKSLVRQTVSRAVKVERSLVHVQLWTLFQTEISNHKTHLDSEHAKTRAQSDARHDQILLDQEIQKRDKSIDSQNSKLKQADTEKREYEDQLKRVKEENTRLSRQVIVHESQDSTARQSRGEAQITLMTQDMARAAKLLDEVSVVGLDNFHREQLSELLEANKVITDLRLTIEEGQSVDHEAFLKRMDLVMERSDHFTTLDPRERPTLHSQLEGTYWIIGSLVPILTRDPGDTTNRDLLERIYGGKGKGKGKQGTMIVPSVVSGSSVASNGERSAAPSPQANGSNLVVSGPDNSQQTGSSNYTVPTSIQTPNVHPSTSTANPEAIQSQDGPKDMDSALAHALQGVDETGLGLLEDLDLLKDVDVDSIDWNDPVFRNFDIEADPFPEITSPDASGQQ